MKRVAITLLLLLIIAGFVGFAMWNKPHPKAENEAGIAISAPELLQSYTQNEQASNAKYLNKVIRITGTVASVEQNQDGQTVAMLQGPAGGDDLLSAGIMCTMREKAQTLKAGEKVTLKGFCTGYTSDVHLSDCVPAP